jgi:phenylalanyl-tRNA synthetase alpha chain
MELIDRLVVIERESLASLATLNDASTLERWRLEVLGRKGILAEAMKGLGALPATDRPPVGERANAVKQALETAFRTRLADVTVAMNARALEGERIDVTLPARGAPRGSLHPVTKIRREVEQAFARLGFTSVEGPEVEWDHYNFTMLNIPPDHPARDTQDSFYIEGGSSEHGEMLLRTHVSPVQIRTMLAHRPPIRIIAPGRTYRNEATDASHEAMFAQVEGLCVDKGVTLGDLRGTLTVVARTLFGSQSEIRFRCGYFPFVEPGAEIDMTCHMCNGLGCRVCKRTGWIELGGAGMVHPRVLTNAGIDPTVHSGWAFGCGLERFAMLRYGIEDIRLFYENDLRFLRQFS